MIDQKKLLFKQLMTAIDTLGSEIDQLEGERQSITSVSADRTRNILHFFRLLVRLTGRVGVPKFLRQMTRCFVHHF